MIEVTGHRGARGLAPENTLPGFRLAADLGCSNVELDVRLTRDGQLAVIHDETVDRTTNGSGAVASYTMEELERFDAGKGEKIPSLREVFELLKDTGTNIQIELKGPDTEDPCVRLVRELGMEQRVSFTSFFHCRVLRIKNILPELTTGILVASNPVDPIALLVQAGADRLHVNYKVIDSRLVRKVHEGGKKIVAWGAVVEPQIVDRLVAVEVDVIGSDFPDMVIERLRSHSTTDPRGDAGRGGLADMSERT